MMFEKLEQLTIRERAGHQEHDLLALILYGNLLQEILNLKKGDCETEP